MPGSRVNNPPQVWKVYLFLALPFVLCFVYLASSGKVFQAFWAGDEPDYHWPLMQSFAEGFPHVNLLYNGPATTPLYQLLGAVFVRLFGAHLQTMRFLTMLVSIGGVYVLFTTLYRYRRQPLPMATLLTAVFCASCYFFGYSFRVVTDNMAIVFCILAMAQLYRFVDPATERRLPAYLAACGCCCLTILTRQSYLFLCLPLAAILLWSTVPVRSKVIGLCGLALAVLPFAGLVALWHGLVPPPWQVRHTRALLEPYALALPLMLLGFYAPFFESSRLWRRVDPATASPRRWALPLTMALVGCVVVYCFPLFPLASQRARAGYIPDRAWKDVPGYFAGWIYNIGNHLPSLHGNSVLFWILLPCGLATAASYLRVLFPGEGTLQSRLPVLFLLGVVLSSPLNAVSSQKYYDAVVLLFLVWHARPEKERDPFRVAAFIALIVLFCGYHVTLQLSYTGDGRSATRSRLPDAPSPR